MARGISSAATSCRSPPGEEERDAEASIGAFFHPGMTTPILGIAGLHAAFVCVAPRCREAKKTALSGG